MEVSEIDMHYQSLRANIIKILDLVSFSANPEYFILGPCVFLKSGKPLQGNISDVVYPNAD